MNVYQEHSLQENQADNNASGALQKQAVPVLKDTPAQSVQKKERASLQLKSRNGAEVGPFKPIQQKENKTGLPDNLKSGVENLSGTNLSDVKVHYGSSQPAQFNAHAYAQGIDIHVAPGQEQHLPHEAWHVAQQKQGRVQATTQMKGTGINDDASLEKEADDMGAKAMSTSADSFASGYEHFNKKDIGDVKARASLASHAQRQTFENINSGISASLKQINNTSNTSIQKQKVKQLVAGKFLADDGEELKEGQIHKSNFLASLRSEVKKIAKEILEPVGLAQDSCPDLNYWISYYAGKDAAYFEAAIAKYSPATAEATNTDEYLVKLADKVRDALTKHVATGVNEFDPEEVPADVEAKRPPASVLGIQRKIAPIQFGCTSAKNLPADEPTDTGDTKIAGPVIGSLTGVTGSGPRSAALTGPGSGARTAVTGVASSSHARAEPATAERKDDAAKKLKPGDLYSLIESYRSLKEPERCKKVVALFIDAGLAVTHHESVPEDKRNGAPSLEDQDGVVKLELAPFTADSANLNHNYKQIWDCGGTQQMILQRLLGNVTGKKRHDAFSGSIRKGKIGESASPSAKIVSSLAIKQSGPSAEVAESARKAIEPIVSALEEGPCVIPFSTDGGGGHAFTLAGDKAGFFLYQGWVGYHSVLDKRYTRKLTKATLTEFLMTIVSVVPGNPAGKQAPDYAGALAAEDTLREREGKDEEVKADPPKDAFVRTTGTSIFKYEIIPLTPPQSVTLEQTQD